jgi:hypothetical protein
VTCCSYRPPRDRCPRPLRALSVAPRPIACPSARAPDRPSRRRVALGQARRRLLRTRLRREQDPQARVPGRRSTRPGLRHARLDRRGAVEPHGRWQPLPHEPVSGACSSRRAGSTGPTSSTTGSGTSSSRGSSAPRCGSSRPTFGIGFKESWEQALADVEAAAGSLCDPGRRVRPPAGRPRLRALGAGGGRAGGRSWAASSTR